ncbi:YfhO family protein [Lentzea kentuckyensis]|uniref:YfhO family protein n=1 Tax=Lentzea kentuckyensis TaxID=360086 RepID=UPI00117B11BF|nr:YfhO family protein [Lentzea kentuckyensis]
MTATLSPAVPSGKPGFRERVTPPFTMVVLVLLGAIIPMYRNHIFYFWDDTAAAAVPVWQRVGEAFSEGRMPLLELDMWRGGNFAAEVATGMWNPVEVLLAVSTGWIDNIALGITIVKFAFLVAFSIGTFLLAREYGARPWIAAAIGTALPLSGYVLFMDGTSWINALTTYGFLPYVWWTARRTARLGKSTAWVVLTGFLAATTGNPYVLVSIFLIVLAVSLEAWLAFDKRKVINLFAAGFAVLMLNVIVYLPFSLTSSVSYRKDSRTFNDGFLSPQLQDFFGMSNPAAQPLMNIWSGLNPTFPALYLAWFFLPLLPWFRWSVLWEKRKELLGLYLYTLAYLLLVLGPSNLNVFRWPARLIPFFFIPLVIIWAIVASEGLQKTKTKARTLGSLGIVLVGAYFGWAALPQTNVRQAYTMVIVMIAVLVLLRVGIGSFKGFAVMAVGTIGFLAMQTAWFPGNYSVADYKFPTSEKGLEQRFEHRYEGVTVSLSDIGKVKPGDLYPGGAYQDFIFGTNFSVANVEALTAYSGVGFNAMDQALCTAYNGAVTCPESWKSLWTPPPGSNKPLADLLRAETVVVQNNLIDTRDVPAPEGWHKAESSDRVVVWKRNDKLAFPDGRLSSYPDGTRIESDRMTGKVSEEVKFSGANGGKLVFSRLAWPGYVAKVNGQDVPAKLGPAGLLEVELPKGVREGTLQIDWVMPGMTIGLITGAVGIVLTLGLIFLDRSQRRRRRDEPQRNSDLEPLDDVIRETVGTGDRK